MVGAPEGAKDISYLRYVQRGKSAHPAFYLMVTGQSSLGKKQPKCEAGSSSLPSIDDKNAWSYNSTSPHMLS
jgi:hypothetical protein